MRNKLIPRLLDYIYPPSCHQCDCSTQDGRYLCASCYDASALLQAPFCKKCGEGFDGKIQETPLCPNCHDLQFHFTFARAALRNTGPNHQLVVDFKYQKQFHLAGELARFCADTLQLDPRFQQLPAPILIPIPLHWKRQWKRGFNQAEELAREISKLTDLPFHKSLRRIRNTQTQTRLGRNDRLKNLKNAFKLRKIPSRFRSAILVDDVFTTGSTADACAAELKKHAPQLENIVVLTALRG